MDRTEQQIADCLIGQETDCLTVRQPGPDGNWIDRPHVSCPRLTAGWFLLMCWSYGVKIQGGTIHDFLQHCTVEYQRQARQCNTYQVYYHADNGTKVRIGGNFAPDKPNLLPLAKLDFAG